MKETIAALSIGANGLLAGSKIAVGIFSHSSAILAAGIDSLADIVASAISYIGIRISAKPADQEHPYGHYKFEVLSGVLITAVIAVTGIGILYDAVQDILNPKPMDVGFWAFVVMACSAVINEGMARIKTYYGKKENSISLLSDGVHSRIDVYTSLVILCGLLVSRYWIYADAILAIGMGIYIIKEAFMIGKEATGSLLDISAGAEVEQTIKTIAEKQQVEITSLKTQKKGSIMTANLEINLPGNLKVDEASKISKGLREALMGKIEQLQYVVIQITSHNLESSFYQPGFGKSFGWQRRGKFTQINSTATGMGPSGDCVCTKCGYHTVHQRGIPCSSMQCPHCGINLERR